MESTGGSGRIRRRGMLRRQFVAGLSAAAAAPGQNGGDRWPSVYRVDPAYPHHLVNHQGRHLFILNKTAWSFFGCKDPRGVLERASAQGVHVIRGGPGGGVFFTVV